jgi:hypothetical protein
MLSFPSTGFSESYEHLLLLSFYGVCQGKNRVFVPAKGKCTPFKTSLETKQVRNLKLQRQGSQQRAFPGLETAQAAIEDQ